MPGRVADPPYNRSTLRVGVGFKPARNEIRDGRIKFAHDGEVEAPDSLSLMLRRRASAVSKPALLRMRM